MPLAKNPTLARSVSVPDGREDGLYPSAYLMSDRSSLRKPIAVVYDVVVLVCWMSAPALTTKPVPRSSRLRP